jgi:alpha-D-ribose 1-methylphosphonate 5-triphosphate synthase subunit PhnG
MNALSLTPDYDTLRAPEIGLVQIQARMGGTGERFSPETPPHPRRDPPEQRHAGLQLRAGRDKAHAERCAVIDALLQEQPHFQTLMETLIAPLEADRAARLPHVRPK